MSPITETIPTSQKTRAVQQGRQRGFLATTNVVRDTTESDVVVRLGPYILSFINI